MICALQSAPTGDRKRVGEDENRGQDCGRSIRGRKSGDDSVPARRRWSRKSRPPAARGRNWAHMDVGNPGEAAVQGWMPMKSRGLNTMAAPSFVYTIACVAKMLGEPEDWLDELATMNLGPEDGCLGIIDDLDVPSEQLVSVTAFTDAGIEALKELVAEAKRQSGETGRKGR